MARFFSSVVCAGEAARRKPHPEPLLLALSRLGIPAAPAAYVGDSPEDIEMAQAAGAYPVGIPGGFPNGEALRGSRPRLLAGTLAAAADHLLS
jgi:phosphoglycolate phosphatase-like HAD superfamily hydrolase